MQLSYRGRPYTPMTPELSTTEQSFEGQFLGGSSQLRTTYRSGVPNAAVPLTYRGQPYLGHR